MGARESCHPESVQAGLGWSEHGRGGGPGTLGSWKSGKRAGGMATQAKNAHVLNTVIIARA
jgi:hypothetical protein